MSGRALFLIIVLGTFFMIGKSLMKSNKSPRQNNLNPNFEQNKVEVSEKSFATNYKLSYSI